MTTPVDRDDLPAEEENGGDEGLPGTEINIRRIEIIHVVLILLTVGIAYVWERQMSLSIFLGGAIMATSFRIIAVVMRSVFGKGRVNALALGTYWLKFAAMMTAVGVLILIYDVDATGLLVGLTLIVPSIVLETVMKLAKSGEAGGQGS